MKREGFFYKLRNFGGGLCLFEEDFSFQILGWFIRLPFLKRWHRHPHEIMEKWGFSWCERTLHLNWGDKCKVIYMPWDWRHIRHEVLRPDGSWVPYVGSYEKNKEPDGRKKQRFPYHYTLESGEVQERTAEVYVNRMEWRWRWFKWLPWPRKVRTSIDVTFDGEVGERTGSWKGGTIGCGYEMKKGETPEDTLRRMERERKFN